MIDRKEDVESLARPRSALELKRWLLSVPWWARHKVRSWWGGKLLTWGQASALFVGREYFVPRKDNVAGHFVRVKPLLES